MATKEEKQANLAFMLGAGIVLIFFVAIIGPISWAAREPEMRETMVDMSTGMAVGDEKVYTLAKGMLYSKDNELVIESKKQDAAAVKAYRKICASTLMPFDMKTMGPAEEVMFPIWDEYYPLIGANGLLTQMHKEWVKRGASGSLPARHHFGEWLAMKADGRWRDMIEVAARPDLNHAQLHGSVWHAVLHHGTDDMEEMMAFVMEELCFFRHYDGMFDIFQSCAHGVGHGLGMLYPPEQSGEAARICALSNDYDFAASCATGIYMTLMEPLAPAHPAWLNTWTPCDQDPFPANCFRFKGHDFTKVAKAGYSPQSICSGMRDKYHQLGCVWGISFYNSHKHMWDSLEADYCRAYLPEENPDEEPVFALDMYLACLSGVWTRFWQYKETTSKKVEVCLAQPYPAAQRLCSRYLHKDKNTLMDETATWYEESLLEKYAEPGWPRPKPALWHLGKKDQEGETDYVNTRSHEAEDLSAEAFEAAFYEDSSAE